MMKQLKVQHEAETTKNTKEQKEKVYEMHQKLKADKASKKAIIQAVSENADLILNKHELAETEQRKEKEKS